MACNGAPFSPRKERRSEMQRTWQLDSCQVVSVESGSFLPNCHFQGCLKRDGELPFCSCAGRGSVGSWGSWRSVFLSMHRAGLSGERGKLEKCLSVHAQGGAQWGAGEAGTERTLGGQGHRRLPPASHGPSPPDPWGLTFVLRLGLGRDAVG